MGGHWKREQRRPLPRAGAGGASVTLTPAEVAIVTRTIVGLGGHQGLLLRLVPRIGRDGRLELTADDVVRVRSYATSYGNGGYQDRFRAIVAALERERDDPDTRGNR